MVITFGKYKDQDISEIPGDYLAWLESEGIRSPQLAKAVTAELARRGPAATTKAPTPTTSSPLAAALKSSTRPSPRSTMLSTHEVEREGTRRPPYQREASGRWWRSRAWE